MVGSVPGIILIITTFTLRPLLILYMYGLIQTKRLCVAKCPTGNETALDCLPSDSLSCKANSNPKFEVSIYPTVESDTSMGLFCMPVDPKIKETIL
jgi:hypothetical protein